MMFTRASVRLAVLGAGIACIPLLGQPAAALPVGTFEVTMTVTGGGGTSGAVSVPVSIDELGNGFIESLVMTNADFATNPEWQVTLNAYMDPDPVIDYSASVIDFGGASSFGFMFSQAIVPTAAPGEVSHTHSSSTTSGGGAADTVPVTAAAPPAGVPVDGDATAEIAVYTVSTNGGTTLLNAGLDLSPSFVGAGPSDTQGPFSEGLVPGPAGSGSYDFMRVDVNFSMAGGNDAYTFNGQAVVIPEPATLALVGLGLGALYAGGRRRR